MQVANICAKCSAPKSLEQKLRQQQNANVHVLEGPKLKKNWQLSHLLGERV